MLKKVFLFIAMIFFSGLSAQEKNSLYNTKKIAISKDTIYLEKFSINSNYFKLLDENQQPIDTTFYKVFFEKGTLLLSKNITSKTDSLTVSYLNFPEFLTREYRNYDKSRIVSNEAGTAKIYQSEPQNKPKVIPLDGLTTSGSISRGMTIGNNQNAVLNSNLDLQITGKISDNVSIRASLQDNNIPLQDGGYSQKLDQFDNIFMEIFSNNWSLRAGDIFLENRNTSFLNFNKKVQGLATNFNFGSEENKTNVFASVALVRGQYAKSDFIGQEGNQGPYKLVGKNGELYVLVISGSERVYVNGNLLKRGENNDYIIDYNAGEVIFTSLFTITSEMRISIEYQYSEQNYNRFVTYGGVTHDSKKWRFATYLYAESDLKNQPLQQNLSQEQVAILGNAGDDVNAMIAPSAYIDSYSDNKILYKKTLINGIEIFEFSNNPDDELYNVRFSLVGSSIGNYIIKDNTAVNRIYEYVEPINGIPQGNYAPVVQLVAPIKTQVATFLGKYNPSEKTIVDFELGVSNNDANLFSTTDDSNNKGIATKINVKQRIFTKKFTVDGFANYQFVQENFKSVERLYNIEFNRDWNVNSLVNFGNQTLLNTGLDFNWSKSSNQMALLTYQFQKLKYSDSYNGNRHVIDGLLQLNNWTIQNHGSYLRSTDLENSSYFLRNNTQIQYRINKNWIGTRIRLEDNQEKNSNTNLFSNLSQKFTEYNEYIGRGDSTKVFAELGYLRRNNDSVQNGILKRVNNSHAWYLKSRIVQTSTANLSVFANYRILDFENPNKKKVSTLNSRVIYSDRFFNQLLQTTTVYETSSGTIPQQEFTYIEVPVGQGVYTWNDYNNNGIQELQEFEVAPFPDQAKYIRIFLPNRVYIKTNQNKFSQSVVLNANQWQNTTGFKKLLSYFYNQTSFILDRKIKNNGDGFELNPFASSNENVLGLNSSFRNSLYYNRGKQKHSLTYTYLQNNTKSLLNIGSQDAKNQSHQLQYNHLIQKTWLIGFFTKTIKTSLTSEDYTDKNYQINGFQIAPKISYLLSKNTSLDFFYELQNKNNQIGNLETFSQNRLGTSFSYAGDKKVTLNGEFSFYHNKFSGNEFSSVGFQMLEGLQVGQNLVWRLLLQKNITQFLDINLNYLGRKGETGNTIHTGNVQLRAYF